MYEIGDRILCEHLGFFYDAKVTRAVITNEDIEYRVHFIVSLFEFCNTSCRSLINKFQILEKKRNRRTSFNISNKSVFLRASK